MFLSHCLLENSIALSMYAPTSKNSTAGVNINLETEYSPSRSSNRALDNDPNDLIHKFVEIHRKETERVSKIYKSRQNVRYGESERESMDIYFKGEEANTPIFVYVHGGYWISLDKSSSGICVASLVDRGYRVIVLDYNLCPSVTLEQLVQQMKKFLKTLLEYAAATNAGGISLCGHSAGAHLIAALMQPDCLEQPHSELIKAMFLISGIYDLRELRFTEAGNPGNILSLDEVSAVKLSPMLYTFPEATKRIEIHILVAEHDSQTFRRQSEVFCKKIKSQEILASCRVFAGYDHFTIIEDMRNDKSMITEYLLNVLNMC